MEFLFLIYGVIMNVALDLFECDLSVSACGESFHFSSEELSPRIPPLVLVYVVSVSPTLCLVFEEDSFDSSSSFKLLFPNTDSMLWVCPEFLPLFMSLWLSSQSCESSDYSLQPVFGLSFYCYWSISSRMISILLLMASVLYFDF